MKKTFFAKNLIGKCQFSKSRRLGLPSDAHASVSGKHRTHYLLHRCKKTLRIKETSHPERFRLSSEAPGAELVVTVQ